MLRFQDLADDQLLGVDIRLGRLPADELLDHAEEITVVGLALVADGLGIIAVHDDLARRVAVAVHRRHFPAAAVETDHGHADGLRAAFEDPFDHRLFAFFGVAGCFVFFGCVSGHADSPSGCVMRTVSYIPLIGPRIKAKNVRSGACGPGRGAPSFSLTKFGPSFMKERFFCRVFPCFKVEKHPVLADNSFILEVVPCTRSLLTKTSVPVAKSV